MTKPRKTRKQAMPMRNAPNGQFNLDHLTPGQFEEFCYDLLEGMGAQDIRWRKGTGLDSGSADSGRDLECTFTVDEADGDSRKEVCFVQCKHYKRGVPPGALEATLTWASANRPNRVLFIVSNFLSNPARAFLEEYERKNRPTFSLKVWDKKRLEGLTLQNPALLGKYQIPHQALMGAHWHPSHVQFLGWPWDFKLRDVFLPLDLLDSDTREAMLSDVGQALKPRRRSGHLDILKPLKPENASFDYEEFKMRLLESSKILDDRVLAWSLVSRILHQLAFEAEPQLIADRIGFNLQLADQMRTRLQDKKLSGAQRLVLENNVLFVERVAHELPFRTKVRKMAYTHFCNAVLTPLLRRQASRQFEATKEQLSADFPLVDLRLD